MIEVITPRIDIDLDAERRQFPHSLLKELSDGSTDLAAGLVKTLHRPDSSDAALTVVSPSGAELETSTRPGFFRLLSPPGRASRAHSPTSACCGGAVVGKETTG